MSVVLRFLAGLLKFPVFVQVWLMILGVSNMVCPIFFFGKSEAQIMFGATMLSFAIGVLLFQRQGMTRLLGVMHIPWVCALYFLVTSDHFMVFEDFFGIWMTGAATLTGVCLLVDLLDVCRYLRGDRERLA
ncbi:MAG: hypothetical protein ACE5FU_15205 [Nitrospinota bacterium]